MNWSSRENYTRRNVVKHLCPRQMEMNSCPVNKNLNDIQCLCAPAVCVQCLCGTPSAFVVLPVPVWCSWSVHPVPVQCSGGVSSACVVLQQCVSSAHVVLWQCASSACVVLWQCVSSACAVLPVSVRCSCSVHLEAGCSEWSQGFCLIWCLAIFGHHSCVQAS